MSRLPFRTKSTAGLVSIVIPTFNKDRYIGATLDSISSQTYSDWEVIVVEDSSRGETEQIVANFARQHRSHRVDYTRNDRNYGAAQTRNIAFDRAHGRYIALLDADDRWLPDHLARSVAALQQSGKDIVYSSVLMIEDQTELPLAVWGPDVQDLRVFPSTLFRRNFITPSATVMKREVLADVGPWGLGFRYCEDADYWFRCVVAGKQFLHIGGCQCLYRKNHEGATTHRLCGTLEEFAEIAERYCRQVVGVRHSHTTKHAAEACINAAEFHARANPQYDPSADPSRSAALAMKAWRLRRKKLYYLWRSLRYRTRDLTRRSRRATHRITSSVSAPFTRANIARKAA